MKFLKLSTLLILALALFAGLTVNSKPKEGTNIIFMIGDGMGPAYTGNYRYYMDDLTTPEVESTVFDRLLVGMSTTYPADKTIVTDSAASATALASGIKSYNGAVGVDAGVKPVVTLLDRAKEMGYNTGIVSTSQINHATPASFIAKVPNRKQYDKIANQYFDKRIDGKIKADLMLGGGTKYFIRDDRNLVEEFKGEGFTYIDELDQLDTLETLPAMGLFAKKGLPFGIDSDPNRLAKMTKKSLELMSKSDTPFFLMIEGSQIDWCGHSNDIACAMTEMHDFAQSLELVEAFVKNNPNTIVVVTADHNTGGLSAGANKDYIWKRELIKKVSSSVEKISRAMYDDPENWVKIFEEGTGLTLSEKQKKQIEAQLKAKDEDFWRLVATAISDITVTGWTTWGHTAEDVQIFATGAGSEKFVGLMDNTDIAKKLFEILEGR